ncbi:MAG: rhomboid family intramembrane serine protease [Gemmatimonadaceae bacterium]
MIPLSDENPTIRTPVATFGILGLMAATWFLAQGAGFNPVSLAASVCNYGMVPAELTHTRAIGFSIPIGAGLACSIDNEAVNILTPLTSMFLHGSWAHLLGNALFFWVFGNNIEDSMGRARFVVFYLVCGLIAAAAHVFVDPTSPVPTVGASGAISGIMGAYLILYPRVRVRMLFIFFVIPVRAWLVLLWWFVLQVLSGLPQLMMLNPEVSSGVAVWAHVGGFVAGMVLVKPFVNPDLQRRRTALGDARVVFTNPAP